MYTHYQLKFELKGTIETKLNSLQKLRFREVKWLTREGMLESHGGDQWLSGHLSDWLAIPLQCLSHLLFPS